MRTRLLAVGLTLALHLALGLALLLRLQHGGNLLPPRLGVSLCRLVDRVPAVAREPPAPLPAPGGRRPPEAMKPDSRGTAKSLSRPSAPPRDLPRAARPPRKEPPTAKARVSPEPTMVSGEKKPPAAGRPAPDLVQAPAAAQNNGPVSTHAEKSRPAATPAPAAGIAAPGGKTISAPGHPLPRRAIAESSPRYKETPKPVYPALARRMGYQGTVELEVLVAVEGTVEESRMTRSSGYPLLDDAALGAVRRWRFEPGTRDGEKSAMWIKIPVHFSLR